MKTKVKSMSVITIILIAFIVLMNVKPLYATTNEVTVINEYTVSDSISAVLYSDGTLDIAGSGILGESWSGYRNVSWYDQRQSIVTVTMSDGITGVGQYAFYGCSSLKSINIPEGVTELSRNAFYGCSALETIVLPEGLTTLGQNVFQNCSSLAQMTIPSTVTSVTSSGIFSGCKALTTVTFAEGMTVIPDYICRSATALTTVNFGENAVTEIGQYAFYGCSSLEKVTIPETVTIMESDAFYGCSALENVVLPEGLTTLGQDVFRNCTSLTEMTIPSAITSVASAGIFNGCTSLTTIIFAEGTTVIPNYICRNAPALKNVDFGENAITEIGNYAFSGCSSLETVAIPDAVTSIGEYAFSACANLSSVTFPEGVTTLGRYVFQNCTSLTAMTIPSTIESVNSNGIFSGCTAFESVTFAEGTTKIPNYICRNAAALKNVDFGENAITEIDTYAFYGCKGLTAITIPDTVTTIGDYAFGGCESLSEIILPDALTTIGSYAFQNCDGITEVTIPATLTSVGSNGPFYGCISLEKVTFADGITVVPAYVCRNMTALKTVFFEGNGITEIGDYAFYGCTNLNSVKLPESLLKIKSYAFYNCALLSEIILPDALTDIGNSAFYGCANLDLIISGSQITNIGYRAFYHSGELMDTLLIAGNDVMKEYAWTDYGREVIYHEKEYTAGANVKAYLFTNGMLAFQGQGEMNSWTSDTIPWKDDISKIKYINIGIGITTIGDYMASGMNIDMVIIGDDVESIGQRAFYGCTKLKMITIGAGVTLIGESAFYTEDAKEIFLFTDNEAVINYNWTDDHCVLIEDAQCFQITKRLYGIYLNNILTITGYGPMRDYNTTSMPWYSVREEITKVVIEDGVKYIGAYSFYNHTGLKEVVITETVTQTGGRVFYGCTNLHTVVLPSELLQIGDYTFYGCTSLANITIPSSVTQIGNYAFYGCESLTSAELPHDLEVLGSYAFYNCSSLLTTNIEETSLETIKTYTYYGCTSLKRITLSSAIKSVEAYAFSGCSSINTVRLGNGITSLGGGAFENCVKITEITIPRSLATASVASSKGPFFGCTGLTDIQFADKVRSIAPYLFYGCSSITAMEIPDTVSEIGNYAFYGCTGLLDITLPESLYSIGNYAFYGCTGLTSIAFPKDVITVGTYLFDGCTNLKEVTLNSRIQTIPAGMFRGTSIESIEIPYGVATIGNYAFTDTKSFTFITIPAFTKTISSSAFNHESLTIGGAPGSAAETYAADKGYTFIAGIASETLTLSPTKINLALNQTSYLNAVVTPQNMTDSIEWSSSDETVVTVEQNASYPERAVVKGIAAGSATITVKAGAFTQTCTVVVADYVTAIKLNKTYIYLEDFSETYQLTATVTPSTAINKELVWSSSNDFVATVNQNGVVTPVSTGTVRITVSTKDGAVRAYCFVNVAVHVPVTGIALDHSEIFTTGAKKTLSAIVRPSNASNKDVLWSSSDETVATVNGVGVVTPVSDGTAVITATTKEGSFTASCTVIVQSVEVKVTGVTLDYEELDFNNAGETVTLKAMVEPLDADIQKVIWTSSNPEVATVDEKGTVTSKKGGTTVITAVTVDGEFEVSCTVRVVKLVTSVTVAPKEIKMRAGQTQKLNLSVLPEDALNPMVNWYSTNKNVAIVDSKGNVTAVAKGTAAIKCRSTDGSNQVGTCTIVVLGEDEVVTPEPETPVQPSTPTKPAVPFKTNIDGATVKLSGNSFTYTGKAIAPTVTVTIGGKTLTKGTDFTVVYKDNIKVGTAKVIITGAGNYQGTVNATFTIKAVAKPARVKIKSISAGKKYLKLKWGKVSGKGYEIQYSLKKNFKPASQVKTVTVKSYKTVSKKINKLKSKKTYWVRIRAYKVVNGEKIYGKWSVAKKKKVK